MLCYRAGSMNLHFKTTPTTPFALCMGLIGWAMGSREQYRCSWVPPTVDSRCSCQGVLDVVTQSAEDTEEPKADLSERREPAGRLRTQAALL